MRKAQTIVILLISGILFYACTPEKDPVLQKAIDIHQESVYLYQTLTETRDSAWMRLNELAILSKVTSKKGYPQVLSDIAMAEQGDLFKPFQSRGGLQKLETGEGKQSLILRQSQNLHGPIVYEVPIFWEDHIFFDLVIDFEPLDSALAVWRGTFSDVTAPDISPKKALSLQMEQYKSLVDIYDNFVNASWIEDLGERAFVSGEIRSHLND